MVYAIIVVLVLLVFYIISIYNKLKATQQRVREAWSNIDTQLKRRYDLIPNLVETVKGYAKYESETFEAVVRARSEAMNNQSADTQTRAKDENSLSNTLKSLFALSERYPDLKANQNYMQMQSELVDTEDKIQAARSFYNTSVLSLNTQVDTFPSNIVAKRFGIEKASFFELDKGERTVVKDAPKVSF